MSQDRAPPPTIADLKALGLTGALVTCSAVNCLRSQPVVWATIGLPDDTLFPEIVRLRRFRCTACGGRAVHLMGDWRGYKAQGAGER